MMEDTIAFLGTGNMAGAIIGGILRAEFTPDEHLYLFDVDTSKYKRFQDHSLHFCTTLKEAIANAKYIVIAVKPQNCAELFEQIRKVGADLSKKVFVSIAAGVEMASGCKGVSDDVAVVRAMPNTPLLIGQGVTALSRNSNVSDEDFLFVQNMFSKSGSAFELPEDQMNAVISVTSSSPAYIYLFIKAIIDGAAAQGLMGNEIRDAVCDMVIGSANMIKKGDHSPEELIRMVTSPKGTTEQAMNVFAESKLEETVKKAMEACTKRAAELSALLR